MPGISRRGVRNRKTSPLGGHQSSNVDISKTNAKNCPECGRLYLDSGAGMCMDCLRLRDLMMTEISVFVREHPHCSVEDICMGTDAKESLVLYMLRRGYLADEKTDIKYPCERCGKMIKRGRYCSKCRLKIRDEFTKYNKPVDESVTSDGVIYSTSEWIVDN